MRVSGPPPAADKAADGCLTLFGGGWLLVALLLPLGYGMAESDNVTLLSFWMVVTGGVGVALMLLARRGGNR